jgi:hypothetical protein
VNAVQPTYTHFGIIEDSDGRPLSVIGFTDKEARDDWRWRWGKEFPYTDNYDHSLKVAAPTDPAVTSAVEKRLVEDPSTHYRKWEAWDASEKLAFEARENEREQRQAEAWEAAQQSKQARPEPAPGFVEAAPNRPDAIRIWLPERVKGKHRLRAHWAYAPPSTSRAAIALVAGVTPDAIRIPAGKRRIARAATVRIIRALIRAIRREAHPVRLAAARAARAIGPSQWKVSGTWVTRNGRRHYRRGHTAHRHVRRRRS